jgi:peptidoglycan/xylan/chitin deacetylase (PgdA/CDA1 family)
MFRPPVGHKTFLTMSALRRTGHKMVTWNVRSYDGLAGATPQKILDRLLPRCGAGDIVILHDGVEPNRRRDPAVTVEALKPLVLGLRKRGLEPARLDEMTGISSYF